MNMKKSMMFLTGLALAASLSVSTALAGSATVTAEKSANVRAGAGMNYPVINWAMHGDTLETLGTSGSWTRVVLKNGKEGYIHSSLLNAAPSSPSAGTTATITAEKSANIRSKADMNSKIIGWAMHGDTVTVLEKGSKWTKIETRKGTIGYIHNSLLNGKTPSAPSVGTTATITAEKSANIRSEADMNGKVIGWAMHGDTVTVLDKGSKWTKIETKKGTVGYIHNSLLK